MKKKRYFGRGAMTLLAAVFAFLFLMPTVLTIADSFMTQTELTADYGETHHAGTLRCRCGAPNCRGAL